MTTHRGDLFDPRCPTRQILDRLGTKWTSMAITVLTAAEPEPVRFAELRRRMPGVSAKMLSATLRELAADGLVGRSVAGTVPPQVSYRLTPLGRSLAEPLAILREWAEAHAAEIDDHRARGGDSAARARLDHRSGSSST
ncbi:helix-turn-helix domain-containing protein [Nocardia sp. NPDC050697]|uniref:winged helix-turn-helix transcriptional regulator n=1 Tax=Nocardia sp. NPDC050697 TaxID=3155158 RepID=UPI0033EA682F